jgi:hypothetical protein
MKARPIIKRNFDWKYFQNANWFYKVNGKNDKCFAVQQDLSSVWRINKCNIPTVLTFKRVSETETSNKYLINEK